MPEPKEISTRHNLAGFFALMSAFGGWYKMSGTAAVGSATWLFDTTLIVVGTIGVIVTLLWPRRN